MESEEEIRAFLDEILEDFKGKPLTFMILDEIAGRIRRELLNIGISPLTWDKKIVMPQLEVMKTESYNTKPIYPIYNAYIQLTRSQRKIDIRILDKNDLRSLEELVKEVLHVERIT